MNDGRVAPVDDPVEIGMGQRTVAQSIAGAFGVSKDEVLKRYRAIGDVGDLAYDLANRRGAPGAELSIGIVFTAMLDVSRLIARTPALGWALSVAGQRDAWPTEEEDGRMRMRGNLLRHGTEGVAIDGIEAATSHDDEDHPLALAQLAGALCAGLLLPRPHKDVDGDKAARSSRCPAAHSEATVKPAGSAYDSVSIPLW